jgi:hypothetical protein
MSTTKIKTPTGANGATASNEPRNYRTNPETEARIDDWIKEYPKDWKYITDMPVDRLRRTVVLNDIRRTEAIERRDEEILKAVNDDPKRKQGYDAVTEGMSPEQREDFIIKAEREKWRTQQQTQGQTQTTAKRESVGVGV